MVSNELKGHHTIISELIGQKSFCYLDIPVHDNVGDLLIMLGTLEFFKVNNLTPAKIASVHNFSNTAVDEGVVLLHGGGNLGDLYPLHQNFRDRIITKNINKRIIVLPQTIYFSSNEEYKKCCEIWSLHPDLHVFVRDKKSFEYAKGMTCNVYLVPDMAHNLQVFENKSLLPRINKLGIARQDVEAVKSEKFDSCDYITDWSSELSGSKGMVKLMVYMHKIVALTRLDFLVRFTSYIWILYSKRLVKKIIDLYSRSDEIYTNRLHGHILAVLMKKKHSVLDNSYGKNWDYLEAWTKEIKGVCKCE
jgi:pyruvyl transferase EpsO